MALDLSFKQVCKLIKQDLKAEPKLIEDVDKLLSLALLCSPVVLGSTAAALLPTLATKNELIKLGKGLFEKLTKKSDDDYVARHQRMQMAYGLLVFTAFYDAIDACLPNDLREKIKLLDSEKAFLAKNALEKVEGDAKGSRSPCEPSDAPIASILIAFPHPTESLEQQMERHRNLWGQMAQGFREFLQKLAVWEEMKEPEHVQILGAFQKIDDEASKVFEAEYFELCRRFEDFAVWSNLHEHKKTKELIAQLSSYVRQHVALANSDGKTIDIGFTRLHSAVLEIPHTLAIAQAKDIAESLTRHYAARVDDPIIDDKEDTGEGKPRLNFPKVRDAFIPQAFRVLRQVGKGRRLEDEATWDKLPRRTDLGAFLLSYLSSPYSTDAPLLILGHPGSGKSLLTTVLSSQLMSEHFTAIRVPLREVNAEAGIVSQIEEAIRRITNISVDSWARLSAAFKNNPPLVILDGYDELLQASGKVFAGYLKDVQTFQKNEAEQGRPVRVIVTSRVTLIDKATVPSGATIVRLLEFDEVQQAQWVAIWNGENVNYFQEAKVNAFALPTRDESGAEKILTLAQQPLLLLMLALYDSQDNQLKKSEGLDRTKLYDSLLRRFVTRERGKDRGFEDNNPSEKKKALDNEMQRLGVAALGMYNRRKVHILAPDLNDDLRFFNLERPVSVASGKPLSQADLLLGSFFFVHKSQAQHAAGAPETHEELFAFEFLHNTFGEFLTADFILKRAVSQVGTLRALQSNDELREDLEKKLNSADGFGREWLASLVYTPLFTRPVVLDMMREWIDHILGERDLSKGDFVRSLETIIINQIKRLLNKREMPAIICKETAQEGYRALFGDHPLMGHVAIYSINLILLRIIVSDTPFIFDESQVTTHEDGTRPWDRLTHIWRSWFSLDNLNGVTAVMVAERKDAHIVIHAKKRFQIEESQTRLQTSLNVATALADNITSGLTGLLLFEPGSKNNKLPIDDIAGRLRAEKMERELEVATKRLLDCERLLNEDTTDDYLDALRGAIEIAFRNDKMRELEYIALSFRRAARRLRSGRTRSSRFERQFHGAIDPRMIAEVAGRNAEAALLICQSIDELGNNEWSYRFYREFLDFGFRRHHPAEVFERNPEAIIAWAQLARKAGGWPPLDRRESKFFHPEFFDRGLDIRFLLELIDRRPDAALAWLQLIRELGASRFFDRRGEEFLERAFDPRRFSDLVEKNPEVALQWLQLAREFGGKHFRDRFDKNFRDADTFARALTPRRLFELAEENPEAALTWVQILRELGGDRFPSRVQQKLFGDDFFERLLHPRRLMEVSERNPGKVLIWLQLVRELGQARYGRGFGAKFFPPEFFERFAHPRYFLGLIEQSPEVGLAWLQMAMEFGGERIFDGPGEEFFERIFNTFTLNRLLRRNPASFAVVLRLARRSGTRSVVNAVADCLLTGLELDRSVLGSLPITALPDLKWVAGEAAGADLKSAVDVLVLERSDP